MKATKWNSYGPGFRHFECQIQDLHDKDGVKIDRAPNPMELLTITVPQEVKPGDMIRSCQEGLINLYSKMGQVKLFEYNKKRGLNLSFLLGDAEYYWGPN